MLPTVFVSVSEAAYLAELTDRDLNRVFDERLVPDELLTFDGARGFARLACAFARFYFATDNIFATPLRRSVVAELTERVLASAEKERALALRGTMPRSLWLVQVAHGQSVDLSPLVWHAKLRARKLSLARAHVATSDDVMDGTPVFKGTRVPLDGVTASLDRDIPFGRIQASYEFLTLELAEAARVYQLVHPRRGRRRSIAELHPDWKVTAKRVVRGPTAVAQAVRGRGAGSSAT